MENILEIKDLTKSYDGFTLDKVSLALPKGSIMGFIGSNGAGKTTTIKLILNLIHRDSGCVKVFGLDNLDYERQIKEDLGVVFDESSFPLNMRVPHINKVLGRIYKNWDEAIFFNYIDKFGLPVKKDIKDFSRGMKMKLSIAVALSHHAKLLILDEATSGLDPIVRDDILNLFADFTRDPGHSILIASHILSDLEKLCDYVAFLHKGKLLFCEEKDRLLEEYGIVACTSEQLRAIPKEAFVSAERSKYGARALVKRGALPTELQAEHASIEDIILFMVKGETNR